MTTWTMTRACSRIVSTDIYSTQELLELGKGWMLTSLRLMAL